MTTKKLFYIKIIDYFCGMYDIRYRNINLLAILFEILTLSIWCFMIVCIYNHNFKPILMLLSAGLLSFVCVFSLLGERNNMSPKY